MAMNRMHRKLQKGLGLLGAIIVLLLAAAGAYYLYQQMGGGGGSGGGTAVSSCKGDLEHCMQKCRKASTDSDAAQACQNRCRREARICENLERQSSR